MVKKKQKHDLTAIKLILMFSAIFFFVFSYTSLLFQVTGSVFVEFLMLIAGFGAFVSLFSALIYVISKISQKSF